MPQNDPDLSGKRRGWRGAWNLQHPSTIDTVNTKSDAPISEEGRYRPSLAIWILVAGVIVIAFGGIIHDTWNNRAGTIPGQPPAGNSPRKAPADAPTNATPPANEAKLDPCDGLFDHASQIDNGADRESTGSIRSVTFKTAGDYRELKDCWRKERIDKGWPYVFYDRLALGITMQEVANNLPIVADTSRVRTGWIRETCIDPPYRPGSKVKLSCTVSQPISGVLLREYGAPFPDNLTLRFDDTGTDAKLLGWNLLSSVPVEAYHTTDEVIRFERSSLRNLGPPDVADSAHAKWWFSAADGRTLDISLEVYRHNGVFVKDLEVDDYDSEFNYVQPDREKLPSKANNSNSTGLQEPIAGAIPVDPKLVTKQTEIVGTVFDVQPGGDPCIPNRICWWDVIVERPGNEEWNLLTPEKPSLSKG